MIYEFQIEFKIIFGIETITQKTQTKCQPKLKKIAKFAFVRESIVKKRSRVANPFFRIRIFVFAVKKSNRCALDSFNPSEDVRQSWSHLNVWQKLKLKGKKGSRTFLHLQKEYKEVKGAGVSGSRSWVFDLIEFLRSLIFDRESCPFDRIKRCKIIEFERLRTKNLQACNCQFSPSKIFFWKGRTISRRAEFNSFVVYLLASDLGPGIEVEQISLRIGKGFDFCIRMRTMKS